MSNAQKKEEKTQEYGSFRANVGRKKKDGRPSKNEPMVSIGTTLHKKYRLIEIIGAGGYGQIFKAYWQEKKINVAVKVMSKKHEPQRMILEQRILQQVQNKPNFPYLFGSGNIGDSYMFICMELLGRSLSDLRKNSEKKRFEPTTCIRIAVQVLDALKTFHGMGWVHRDIKPGNMCVGNSPDTFKTVYLVDFGLSRKFRDKDKVIKRKTAGFRGTLRYVSINVHERKDQCPCDDLVSLFYSIIEISESSLPWTRLQDPDEIGKMKIEATAAELCKQQPEKFYDFYTTCYECNDPDRPDYSELLTCLNKCLGNSKPGDPMSYEVILGVVEACPGSVEPTDAD